LSAGSRVELGLGPEGERIELSWELETLRSLPAHPDGDESPWSLDAEPGESLSLVRVLSAAFDDGTTIGLAAIRARSAAGHGEEDLAGFIARPDHDPIEIPEALISTEYDSDGSVRRAGLELWIRESGPPARAAGDRSSASDVRHGGLAGESVRMDFRLDGVQGAAVYDLLRPAG
jgi:hypothetical protein